MNERAIFIAALDKESAGEREAFLDEVCGNDARLRHDVERLLESHQAAGDFLEEPLLGSVADNRSGQDSESDPEQFGDFRIVRELGRGGMGVVYEAEQASLGRRVALKVLAHKSLDSNHKQRFLREAQAVARLHHTNIVPIFGVGESDGLLYYAMQLIEGQSLDDWLVAMRRGEQGDALTTSMHPRGSSVIYTPTVEDKTAEIAAGPFAETRRTAHSSYQQGNNAIASRTEDSYWPWITGIGVQTADAHAHEKGSRWQPLFRETLLFAH